MVKAVSYRHDRIGHCGQTLTTLEYTLEDILTVLEEGSVAEWLRAMGLKSGGPWLKSSTLLLSGFVLGSPDFNSSTKSSP